jgi:hypothetical protein
MGSILGVQCSYLGSKQVALRFLAGLLSFSMLMPRYSLEHVQEAISHVTHYQHVQA